MARSCPGFKAWPRSSAIADLVRWLGFVPEDELADVYRASDLFILCSQEDRSSGDVEGFGLVFLEAQAASVPVVGSRTGGIADAVSDGEGGWLIESRDVGRLATIISRLVRQLARVPRSGPAGPRARRTPVHLGSRTCIASMPRWRMPAIPLADRAMSDQGVTVVVPTLNRNGLRCNRPFAIC